MGSRGERKAVPMGKENPPGDFFRRKEERMTYLHTSYRR